MEQGLPWGKIMVVILLSRGRLEPTGFVYSPWITWHHGERWGSPRRGLGGRRRESREQGAREKGK